MTLNKEVVAQAIETIKAKGWDVNPYTVADEIEVAPADIYRSPESMSQIIAARGGSFTNAAELSLDMPRAVRPQEEPRLCPETLSLNERFSESKTGFSGSAQVQPPINTDLGGEPQLGRPQISRLSAEPTLFEPILDPAAAKIEAEEPPTINLVPDGDSLPNEIISDAEQHWRELESLLKSHATALDEPDSRPPAAKVTEPGILENQLVAGQIAEIVALDQESTDTDLTDIVDAVQAFVTQSETDEDEPVLTGLEPIFTAVPLVEPSSPWSATNPFQLSSLDGSGIFEVSAAVIEAETQADVTVEADQPTEQSLLSESAAATQSVASALPDMPEPKLPVFSESSLAGPHYTFGDLSGNLSHFSPAPKEQANSALSQSFADLQPLPSAAPLKPLASRSGTFPKLSEQPLTEQVVKSDQLPDEMGSFAHDRLYWTAEGVPDLDSFDILEEIDDESLHEIKVIEDVIPPPDGTIANPAEVFGLPEVSEAPSEATNQIESAEVTSLTDSSATPSEVVLAPEELVLIAEVRQAPDTVSGEVLRELVKQQIDHATEHVVEQQIQEPPKPAAIADDLESEILKGAKRNKFVGSKAAEPSRSTNVPTRTVPPEIRKACQILGLRPEDITAASVTSHWKQQIASPGVHPDLGGNTESAIYLNTAKDALLRWLDQQSPKLGKKFGQSGKETKKDSWTKSPKQ